MQNLFSQLTTTDYVQIIGIILSFLIGIIAIVISIVTLKQNNKMIEESTRPFICIYTKMLYIGSGAFFYLVIKNLGGSPAIITKFDTDFNFQRCYKMNNDRDFIKSIIGCVIPSDQSRSCLIDFDKINQDVKFDLSYKSLSGKVYHEEYTIDLKAGTGLVASYAKANDKDLNIIANAMQEMIRHNL